MGITVTVLSATLALLGVAVNGARQAGNDTLSAGIAAQLIGEYQLAEWDSITSGNEDLRYFDDFGEELDGNGASGLAVATANPLPQQQALYLRGRFLAGSPR